MTMCAARVPAITELARTYPWHGTAPGPLTARIWGVPMRAARKPALINALADAIEAAYERRSQTAWERSIACVWCGERCAHPLH